MADKLNKSELAKKLGIGRTTIYYKSKKRIKDELDKELIEEIMSSNPSYGHKRIAIALKMNRKKVLRLMKKFQLKPKISRGKRWLKKEDLGLAPASYGNRIIGVNPNSPDIAWSGDFTYIRLRDSSFIYLATIIDIFTREIIGFAISRRHNRHLVKSAVLDAIKKRGQLPQYFHSDQGSEYQSEEHAAFLENLGVIVSMSKKASPWENGHKESFYSNFKLELGNTRRFRHDGELSEAIYQQIYYYNNHRIHSALKMAPKQFYQLAALKVGGLNKSV